MNPKILVFFNLSQRLAILGVYLSALVICSAKCGLSYTPPKEVYPNVTSSGAAVYSLELGKINTPSGDQIPLFASFVSDSQNFSPYLGSGWRIGLVEMSVSFVDRNTLLFRTPSDDMVYLEKAKSLAGVYRSGSWLGEVDGSKIKISANCGSSIVFRDGRPSSLRTTSGDVITFVYSGRFLKHLRCGARELINFESSPLSDKFTLTFSGSETDVNFNYASRPKVKDSKLRLANSDRAAVKRFSGLANLEYKVSEDGLIHSLSIDAQNQSGLISWNATDGTTFETQHQYRGNWSYRVKRSKGMGVRI